MKAKQIFPLIALAVIWGGYYVASQQAIKGMSVFTVGIVIRLLTMVLLTVIMLAKGELKQLFCTKGVLKRLLLIGLLGFLLDLTAFIGLSLSPAGSGTALLKCDIIFVNLISIIIYKTKFSKLDWLFTLVMLFGVFMVMGVSFSDFSFGNKGAIFFILSALFVSINAFVIKSVQMDPHNPSPDNVIAYYNNFITMVLFFVTALSLGVLGQLELLTTDRGLLLAAILAGIGQTGIYLVYYYDLRRFPVWLVKVFLLFMPLVAALISFALFHERMTAGQVLGMFVVLGGALGILLQQQKKSKQNPELLKER
ncbi:DMT family transporter [Massiliimalia massiliensis]|uniref:DMT family transporter n=1 Tax=Massiliimalia massiliensis TaxID=1852384 RepID=UPI0009861219|nr:DMT family transporter [Massiliimalia massiliensis]